MMRSTASMILALACLAGVMSPVRAQETIERTPNLSGGWVGYGGLMYVNAPIRFATMRPWAEFVALPTFDLGLGLPFNTLVGGRFAPQSSTVPGRPDEWEVFGRYRPIAEARGAPVDLSLTVGYNGAAESVDGELSLARWLGPLRLLGAARAMSSPFGMEDMDFALAGGAVIHPISGHLPLAIAGDVATMIDRPEGEPLAWSAGLQLGVSYTDLTLSLFATNTMSATLQGVSRGTDRIQYGIEVTIPIPAGRLFGAYTPREQAMEAVVPQPDDVGPVVRAEARNYLFFPDVLEIEAGTTIEWTNRDQMVHTVDADDGSWRSGGIQFGESWRARFDRPGKYTYHCGPHPFMKGIVIVR